MIWAQICFAVLALAGTIGSGMSLQKMITKDKKEDPEYHESKGRSSFLKMFMGLYTVVFSATYWFLAYFAGAFDKIAPKFWE